MLVYPVSEVALKRGFRQLTDLPMRRWGSPRRSLLGIIAETPKPRAALNFLRGFSDG